MAFFFIVQMIVRNLRIITMLCGVSVLTYDHYGSLCHNLNNVKDSKPWYEPVIRSKSLEQTFYHYKGPNCNNSSPWVCLDILST